MSKFGWCLDGKHDQCRVRAGESPGDIPKILACSCSCHGERCSDPHALGCTEDADNGEGWDGACGACADRLERVPE